MLTQSSFSDLIIEITLQCRCRPSHRLPNVVRRPYLGEILERASSKQRANSFSCDKIGFIQRLPQKWEVSPKWLREQYMEKYYEYRNYEKNQVSVRIPTSEVQTYPLGWGKALVAFLFDIL